MASKKASPSKQQLGRAAQTAAYARLHEAHKEELERYMIEERVARGLPLRPQGPTKAEREEQIRKLEERLKRWRDELEGLE